MKKTMMKAAILALVLNISNVPASYADDQPFYSRIINAILTHMEERRKRQEQAIEEEYCWQGQCVISLGIRG